MPDIGDRTLPDGLRQQQCQLQEQTDALAETKERAAQLDAVHRAERRTREALQEQMEAAQEGASGRILKLEQVYGKKLRAVEEELAQSRTAHQASQAQLRTFAMLI